MESIHTSIAIGIDYAIYDRVEIGIELPFTLSSIVDRNAFVKKLYENPDLIAKKMKKVKLKSVIISLGYQFGERN